MLGAIIGDIVGSIYEWNNIKTTEFEFFSKRCFFTDDTVLTAATASVLMTGGDYTQAYQDFSRRYPGRGYGGNFSSWIHTDHPQPYNSWGNGSAMRISPIGFAFDTFEEVLSEAERSAAVTHNHPEGIKGAQATALAILLARKGATQPEIRKEISQRFAYDMNRSLAEIRPIYQFNESCQETVPEAILAFLESNGFEDAIRKAISLGGDSDTLACITGGIAEAYFGIPEDLAQQGRGFLPQEFLQILDDFQQYCQR